MTALEKALLKELKKGRMTLGTLRERVRASEDDVQDALDNLRRERLIMLERPHVVTPRGGLQATSTLLYTYLRPAGV